MASIPKATQLQPGLPLLLSQPLQNFVRSSSVLFVNLMSQLLQPNLSKRISALWALNYQYFATIFPQAEAVVCIAWNPIAVSTALKNK
jgi:hypothetical protein